MQHKLFVLIPAILLLLVVGVTGLAPGRAPLADASLGIQTVSSAPLATLGPLGSAFTYQGRLIDSNVPADGQYDFIFNLFDAATSGTQIGTQTLLNEAVTDGLFTVTLDFGITAFQGDARWLQISVRVVGGPTYTTLTPRVALTPVPYSMVAGTVLGLSGWERDESSTTNPIITFENTILPQHGYAQHIVTPEEVTLGYYDHTVVFPEAYRSGTVPTVTFTYTGESGSANDVPKGGTTNGEGDNVGRLYSVTNTGFTLRGSGINAGRRNGFHWISFGQR